MKIFLAFILFISCSAIISCSDDGASNPQENDLLPKKITQVFHDAGSPMTYEATYTFDEGKLIRITSGESYTEFVYDGEKIVEANSFQGDILTKSNVFEYTGNLLTSIMSENERSVYSYSASGKIETLLHQNFTGIDWQTVEMRTFEYDGNGNIVGSTVESTVGGSPSTYEKAFVFDDKNNPFKNVNHYLRLMFTFEAIDPKSVNNPIETYNVSAGGIEQPQFMHDIEYNDDNYPATIEKYTAGGTLSTTTTIEYQ